MTKPQRTRFTRDLCLRLLGAGGFIYLLLSSGVERPTYMLACVGLMVGPTVMRADEKRRDEDE